MDRELAAWFKHEHPDSYGVKGWIKKIGGRLKKWAADPALGSGVPVIVTPLGSKEALLSFPMDHMDESGILVHVVTSDGELIVMAEDWLSGCIPSSFYDLAEEEGPFTDPYDLPETQKYCEERMLRYRKKVGKILGKQWRLLIDEPFTSDRSSRFVWFRKER